MVFLKGEIMSYCHVSAQIAQYAHDCDEIRCSECDSAALIIEQNGNLSSVYCIDCQHEEDNLQG